MTEIPWISDETMRSASALKSMLMLIGGMGQSVSSATSHAPSSLVKHSTLDICGPTIM